MRYWQRIIAVGFGGFFGGALREAIELWLAGPFPWGTIVINLLGTFISAFLVVLFARKLNLKQTTADFIMVGILGAFTTFSTAVLDMVKLGQIWPALLYFSITLIGGVMVVFLARWLAKRTVA
ncbi:CrcB family protein [Weissella muntiaci]|uniref:Fluoride-specific ion channel FluC n=1 Tax=Weissella muntiaci TaxID=2508881 RepID=A0A6C2C992_9LACO|nr:CrcB family protein [Weissella muntiaci]TYC50159.1 CrcB family protein [Weissella muntiaci]